MQVDAIRLQVDAMQLQVDAMQLQVDAIRLQVDAMQLQVDAMQLQVDAMQLSKSVLIFQTMLKNLNVGCVVAQRSTKAELHLKITEGVADFRDDKTSES